MVPVHKEAKSRASEPAQIRSFHLARSVVRIAPCPTTTAAALALVDRGAPITAARTVSSDGTKAGLAGGPLNGWSVIEAADLDAAARLLADHPSPRMGGL